MADKVTHPDTKSLSDHVEHDGQDTTKEFNDSNGLAVDHTSDEYKAIEKRIIQKLDFTLVPILWLLYLFNYLDRNNIA
jgi:hypothetical protein